jgi:hypothetical protein
MLRMCVCMYSCFVENHPIWILKDGPLISEVVLSQCHGERAYRWLVAQLAKLGKNGEEDENSIEECFPDKLTIFTLSK